MILDEPHFRALGPEAASVVRDYPYSAKTGYTTAGRQRLQTRPNLGDTEPPPGSRPMAWPLSWFSRHADWVIVGPAQEDDYIVEQEWPEILL